MYMGTTYLITGAAGHLGHNLTRQLVQAHKKVRALVLPGDRLAAFLPKAAERVEGDVCDPASLRHFFSLPQGEEAVVLHCAGIVTIAARYDQRVYHVNVCGTKNVLAECSAHAVKKLVYVSTVHAIPELPKGQTMTEIYDFSPDRVTGLYAKTKAEATAAVLRAAGQGLNASVVHPSGLSGPFDYGRGHLTQLLTDYCRGRLTAGVKGGYDFADVRDVAAGILSCCDRGVPGECYILSNRYVPLPELFDLFHSATGRRPIHTYLPMWFALGTAALSELYYKLLRQPPLYTAYSLRTLTGNALFSHEKADRALGYTTRPLAETIRDTVNWLRAQGRI